MKKKLTSTELAEAWKAGEMRLRTAARRHWKSIGLWPINEKLMLSLELILGFANLGLWDTPIPVDEGQELPVSDIIERFKLQEFLG